jgi:ABC-2 type transport system ATP-binding protein
MAAVIRDGRIVAQGSLDELAASREPRIELKLARAGEAATLLAARPDVQGTSAGADDRLTVRLRVTTISGEHQITGELVRHLVAHGFAPYGVSSSTERLEDRVLELLSRSDDDAVDRTTEAPTLVEA